MVGVDGTIRFGDGYMEEHHCVGFGQHLVIRAIAGDRASSSLTSSTSLPNLAKIVSAIRSKRSLDRFDRLGRVEEPIDLRMLEVVVIRSSPGELLGLIRVRIKKVERENVLIGCVCGVEFKEI